MDPPDTMASILFRLSRIEEDVKDLQIKFSLYVPTNLNDLKLSSILEAITRIGVSLQELKDAQATLAVKLTEQQESQSKAQIRVLAAAVTTFISILVGVFVGYITHFFH